MDLLPACQALGRELVEQAQGVGVPGPGGGEKFSERPGTYPGEVRALQQRFTVPSGTFTLVLVGKDGGVKMTEARPVPLAEIFALLDSMPMRQQERRDRK